MKLRLAIVLLALVLLFVAVSPVMAAGMPAAHGRTGEEFGGAVSALAQDAPLVLVEHILGCGP